MVSNKVLSAIDNLRDALILDANVCGQGEDEGNASLSETDLATISRLIKEASRQSDTLYNLIDELESIFGEATDWRFS